MEILDSIIISDRRAEEASRKETTGRKVTTPIRRASWMQTPYDGGHLRDQRQTRKHSLAQRK